MVVLGVYNACVMCAFVSVRRDFEAQSDGVVMGNSESTGRALCPRLCVISWCSPEAFV